MRRYHQKQLLEIVNTLNESHGEIEKLFMRNQIKSAIRVLSDCQESAAAMLDFIESLEGEETAMVNILEDYYKLLYKISMEMDKPDCVNMSLVSKRLRKNFIKIQNGIKRDFEAERLEVLFLPYKASMWDSLESIWIAANNDPQCDAFVMPIPYYDRIPNGTLGKMQYEGGLYPEYVPIIDWREYNIAQRHPDIIFIHNPYDSVNYITQVHSDFFCKRLSRLTDMLVYVPYFVCLDDVPKPFCTLPGIIHSDKVIVQSNKIRNTYICEYSEFLKTQKQKDGFGRAEEKFVALGSPKFDKVLNTKFEDCKIPEKWRSLIEKSDGSHKKVILYNTTIGTALTGDERLLSKLQYVFDQFRDRDDVVLLWRPHPLSISTYEAMRPGLLRNYLKLVENYKLKGWGIYDDSADMNWAIAISDAYYGDWSSLVLLYQCSGKPIMIQNIDVMSENKNLNKVAFMNLHNDGESFWFVLRHHNALFRMDKYTWKMEYIGHFPNEKLFELYLFRGICYHKGKLYFAPISASKIAVYDIDAKSFSGIEISCPEIKTKTRYNALLKFCSVVKNNQYLFFVSCTFPAFVRYCLDDGTITYFSDWVQPLNKLVSNPDDIYFRQDPVVNGSCFTIAACNANAVVSFDMDTCISTVYEVGNNKHRYSSICFDGTDYWMPPRHDGPVVRWNLETGEYKEYDFPDGYVGCISSFCSACYANGYVWLFPYQARAAFKINVLDGVISIAEEFQAECEYKKTDKDFLDFNYMQSKSIGNTIYAFTGKTNKLIEYNTETGYRREQPVLLPKEMEEQIRSYAFYKDVSSCRQSHECYFYEDNFASLRGFLGYITKYGDEKNMKMLSNRQIELFKNSVSHADGSSGAAVFSHCKQL